MAVGLFWVRWTDIRHRGGEASASPTLLNRAQTDLTLPDKKKEEVKTPPVQNKEPKTQDKHEARQPRKKTKFEEMQEEKRLAAIWGNPILGRNTPKEGARDGQERNNAQHAARSQEPYNDRNTLEVGSTGSNGRGNRADASLWNTSFDKRGRGQVGVLQAPLSPFTVWPGWKIPVKLVDGIDTDTPGQISAVVVEDVMDSATGMHKLAPAGTRILGSYDDQIQRSQERLPNAWHTLILPNGRPMALGGMPGADRRGVSGIPIETDNHTWEIAGQALLMTVTGAAGQMATRGGYSGNDVDPGDALQMEAGREIRRSGRQVAGRGYRQPTGKAESGEVFFVVVTAPLDFKQPYQEETDVAFGEEE